MHWKGRFCSDYLFSLENIQMLKKALIAIVAGMISTGFAFAQVDVNKADQAALDGIKGVGPTTSRAILEERKSGGEYKDWADFERRVKGIGSKSAARLSDAGLTVNGQGRSATAAAANKAARAADIAESGKPPSKSESKK